MPIVNHYWSKLSNFNCVLDVAKNSGLFAVVMMLCWQLVHVSTDQTVHYTDFSIKQVPYHCFNVDFGQWITTIKTQENRTRSWHDGRI